MPIRGRNLQRTNNRPPHPAALASCRKWTMALLAGAAVAQPATAHDVPKTDVAGDIIVNGLEQTLPQELSRYGSDIATVSEEQGRNAGAEIGIAPCRERVGQYVYIVVVAVALQKKNIVERCVE